MNKSIITMSIEEYENTDKLGLDDTFEFRCKACGKCCKERTDLLVTPYDTFRIASCFGRTMHEIILRYCSVYEGHESHFPIVKIKPVPPDNRCPLLHNSKCAVHSHKPVICRVYPLARIYARTGGSQFYYNGASCKHEPRRITVRDWIADVASDESEKAGRLWTDITMGLYPAIQPDKLKLSQETRDMVMKVIIASLWFNYDMGKPFVPQLEKNYLEAQAFVTYSHHLV